MFNYESLWDVYEMKFVILFLSIVATIALATYLYDKKKDKDKHD
jgi:hypothetical protein